MFGLTALLPVCFMLGRFAVRLIEQPAAVTQILAGSRQLVLLGRSVTVAVSATLVAVAIGVPVAIALAARDLPLKKLFYGMVFIPLLIPPYVTAGAWIHLSSPTGTVNRASCLSNP